MITTTEITRQMPVNRPIRTRASVWNAKNKTPMMAIGVPTSGPIGDNRLVSNDELFSGQIGQVGTQMDGLGHVGVRVGNKNLFYNGFDLDEFGDSRG
ncbi:MAG: hypothetical protein MK179_13915, partial [Pirellulaceae bacterium]|nr:hypothetical protein [Pirellulaceae bacterium]